MGQQWHRLAVWLVVVTTGASVLGQHPARRQAPPERPSKPAGRAVESHAYTVYSDLPAAELEGTLYRLDRMAREYEKRTASLSGRRDDRRLPLYLFSREQDYLRAGGIAGSAGFYDGERLLALIGQRADACAWNVIQHEAFHQYLITRLGEDIPIWLNEGLAEYFGEGVYTGDGFVVGVVQPFRVKRLQEMLRQGDRGLTEVIKISHDQWNEHVDQGNYDIAWSLVHFLAHAEGGAHQGALVEFIKKSSRGGNALAMFEKTVGPVAQVERQWRSYWLEYSDAQIRRIHGEAAVQTLGSFPARPVQGARASFWERQEPVSPRPARSPESNSTAAS